MPTITELLEERGKIEKTLHALVDTAEAENRDLSAEEDEQFQRLIDDDKSLKTRIDRIERTERLDRNVAGRPELKPGGPFWLFGPRWLSWMYGNQ